MRALHVNTHINIGGIGQYIVSLCDALKSKGAECVVASSGGDLEEELKDLGITHRALDIKTKFEFGPKVFKAASSLARIIKEEKIDIIHAHTRVSQVASCLASRKTGIPYVSTCHGFFKPRISRRFFDTWGRKVIAISDPVRAHLEKDFGVDKGRIELIYNGVDIKRFSKNYPQEETAGIRRSLNLKEGPVIGTMGRLSIVKGQRFLIEAMKYVVSENNLAQCLIIGSGKEEKTLKDLAKGLGLEKSVHFAGTVYRDAPLYLSSMDVFVLPSVEEGLGLALLEAMAAQRPCVASNIGGISDIIEDGVNGLLVPVGDAKAMGNAILRVLNGKTLSEGMGKKGKEFVSENFSLDSMAGRIAGLYEKVISEK